ncbi:uncharacterized protein LOC135478317 [Liolophura sinensis]|uniref:uncharacterized protein LOC135478317 n=1 Tax=Liolophura sinensis TaxID=3198878 RepID=UPI003158824A
MAAVQRNSEGQDYRFAEKNLQTGVVDVYGKMDKSMQMFRPALADKHKVGFFSQDRTSQTDVTEVIDLKQMTKVLKNVLADVDVLKREIVLSKNIIQADYEARLRTKAIELYSRVNERMSQVEKLSDERIDSIRRAYRQQLSNAIHRLKAIYTAEMEKKIEEIKREKLGDAASLLDKYNELHLTNERNKSVIEMLRMQLNEAAIRPVHVPEVKKEEPVYNTQFDEEKEEELDNLRDEVRDLENKIERLMEELDVKDEEASELKMDIDNLKDALEKEKIFNQQLRYENEEMKNAHDQEKMASKRQAEDQVILSPYTYVYDLNSARSFLMKKLLGVEFVKFCESG